MNQAVLPLAGVETFRRLLGGPWAAISKVKRVISAMASYGLKSSPQPTF